MLELVDRLELPDGVRIEGAALVDEVRGERYPANPTAVAVLGSAGAPLSVAADDLGTTWRLDPETSRSDVLAFAWHLNEALLANVRPGRSRIARGGSWVALALRLLPAGRLPHSVCHRRLLETSSVVSAVVSCTRALLGRASLVTLVTAILVGHVWLLAGRGSVTPLALGLGTGLALLVHEVGHAVALIGVPASLGLVGRRTFVLHRPVTPARAAVVSLAGPALPVAAGTVLATAGLLAGEPTIALAACPPAAHALSATVACGDGRTACGL